MAVCEIINGTEKVNKEWLCGYSQEKQKEVLELAQGNKKAKFLRFKAIA